MYGLASGCARADGGAGSGWFAGAYSTSYCCCWKWTYPTRPRLAFQITAELEDDWSNSPIWLRQIQRILQWYDEVFRDELGTLKHSKAAMKHCEGMMPVFCKPPSSALCTQGVTGT